MGNTFDDTAGPSPQTVTALDESLLVWSPGWRQQQVQALFSQPNSDEAWDLIVVGGGITGAGIYREAACRGLKVLLLEQQDFAWGTSSRSSKMVHGGLRYLSKGQFGLARDSVRERQSLLRELPGLVEPLPFLMAHYHGAFPGPWLLDKVLALYDGFAGQRYRQYIHQAVEHFWAPGLRREKLTGVTRFADAVTDDARLVMRVLQDGNARGGVALNYVRASSVLEQQGRVCGLKVVDTLTGNTADLQAKSVVNATGAWSDRLRAGLGQGQVIRPLRGSHLVLPQWRLPVAFAVSFMHPQDHRPVFVFPWEGSTVIGTTDLDHDKDLQREAAITSAELDYLLVAANHQFDHANLTSADVVSTWAGVRPVVMEQSAAKAQPDSKKASHKPSDEKREHAIWNDRGLISIAGGKLTTYRLLALAVLAEVADHWQTTAYGDCKLRRQDLQTPTPFARQKNASSERQQRLLGRYGQWAEQISTLRYLPDAVHQPLLSALTERVLSTDTVWAELVWACRRECVQHLDDLLLRRTRVALLLGDQLDHCADQLQALCRAELGWSEQQWQQEWQRYKNIMADFYGLPVDQ